MPDPITGITAGASLLGGVMSSNAAGSAASAQANAANNAAALQAQSTREQLALQREMYNQQRADISPYRQAGLTAQNQLMTYLGLAPQRSTMAPTTQFDEAGYNRAMDQYYASQKQAAGPASGTFTPGYYQDSGQEGGSDTYIEPTFVPGAAAAPGAGALAMPTREQFTTSMPVDQLRVDPNSPDFGRYAGDFAGSAETTLPGAFTPGAESALPAAFTGEVDLQADPGYQFRLSEGLKALDRQAAARGGLISGSALKASSRYGQDMASQEYGNAYNRALTQYGAGVDRANTMYGRDLTSYGSQVDRANTMFGREYDVFQSNRANALNPLMSITGYGQQATNQLGSYGGAFASGAGSAMQTGAANIGNALGAAGQARASGYMGQSNALNSTLGNLSNLAGQYYAKQNTGNNFLGNTSSMGTRVPTTYGPTTSPYGFSGGLYN